MELLHKGRLKHLVSTNTDGLHRRSGVGKDQMSELHGNIYMEECTLCHKEHQHRRYRLTTRKTHLTGHMCDDCGGPLRDNIIHFSMKVFPAAGLPLEVFKRRSDSAVIMRKTRRGKLVIVNLQRTDYDEQAHLRIFAESDQVLVMLMAELELTIPQFTKDFMDE